MESSAEELGRGIGQLCGGMFWVLIIAVIIVLLIREFWCWYWKINHIRKAQDEQTKLLNEIADHLGDLRRMVSKVPTQALSISQSPQLGITSPAAELKATNPDQSSASRRCPNGHVVHDDKIRYCPTCGVPIV